MNPIVPARPSRFRFQPVVLALVGALLFPFGACAQTVAFPGALGFGQYATGGRGGSVYHVTTLADSGAGSFRDAVSHSGRIVVFDVGGYITLKTAVSCSGSLTIAGQTAPGGGIGFRGGEISFASRNNIICRHIRVLPGSETISEGDDCLSLYRATNVICDHVSLEFGPYNNIDGVSDDWQNYPVTAITFQNCIIADPSDYVAADSTTGQQFGAHTECVNGTWSWFYNIFANSHNRNPLAKINTVFVNNILYNCSAGYTTHTSTPFNHDLVNNYFISGPASTSSSSFPWFQVDDNQSIYYSGNLLDGDRDGALSGSLTTPYWYQGGTGTILTSPWSPITASGPTYSPAAAYRIAVSRAGALPFSPVDNLVLSQLKTLGNGTTGTGVGTVGPDGGLYHSQIDTGLANNGYGVINGGVAPIDTDGDGMPDYWEIAVGLNPSSSSDAMTIGADGYANVERYINWLADPHALTGTNTPVDVDLWQYTSGFTNASPVYSVNNASNGVVTLSGGHIAHFVPAANFLGLGGFQFIVTASDGTSYTNTVAVLMTSITTPENLTWQGDGIANVWTIGGPANWYDGTNSVAFVSGDNVTFDDTGSAAPAVNLGGPISAGIVYVLADSQDYTLSGSGYLGGGTSLFKTGNGRLTLDTTNTFSGGTIINDGIVQVGDGISCNGGLAGSVTNNDTLIFATPGTMTSSASISGIGTLTETGPGMLTLSGTQTYTGPTAITAGALIFSGALPHSDITNNGWLGLAPSSSQLYTNVISGPGNVSANSTGALNLCGTNLFTGNLTNNSGFLILSNNSAAGSGTVVYNGGFVVVAANAFITNTFSIPGSSASDLCMMATNSGTATWAGDVNISGSGQWRPGSDGGTLVFLGNASMNSHIFLVPRGAVQFASNAVVSSTASGFLGRDGSGNKRSSNITVRDNASVSMAGCSLGGGKVGGSVTITVQNNGALSLGTNVDLHSIANSAAISSLRLYGGTTAAGGFTKTQSTYTNLILFNGGVLKAGTNNTAFLPAFGAATNLVQAGGAIIDDGGFAITIAGALIHDSGLGSAPDGGLTKLGAGTLTLAGSNSYAGPTFINAGTLALSGSGLVPATTNIYLAPGALFNVSGTINNGNFTLTGAGRLLGSGTCFGLISLTNGATLSPGSNSFGTLVFTNYYPSAAYNLMLKTGCTSSFKLSHSPLTNDTAKISGRVMLGGALVVTNVGATQLAAGDTFTLFDATNFAGAFSSVQLPALPVGLVWNTNALNAAGIISVMLNTAPAFGPISISGGSLGLSGTGGVGNASYILLGSTNLSAAWTPLFTNQFDNLGNFSFTTISDAATPQTFYRLQLR